MRKPLIVRHSQIGDVLSSESLGFRKVVVPEACSDQQTLLLGREWVAWIHDKYPVAESYSLQLSYFNHKAPQEAHWHDNQWEIYCTIAGELDIALQDVDSEDGFAAYLKIQGTVVVPPRFCHYVGTIAENSLVLVIQVSVDSHNNAKGDHQICTPTPDEYSRHRNCPRYPQCNSSKAAKALGCS